EVTVPNDDAFYFFPLIVQRRVVGQDAPLHRSLRAESFDVLILAHQLFHMVTGVEDHNVAADFHCGHVFAYFIIAADGVYFHGIGTPWFYSFCFRCYSKCNSVRDHSVGWRPEAGWRGSAA